jgi:hypothetical protein
VAEPSAPADASASAAPEQTKSIAPVCVLPTWRIASIRCTNGHVLGGLFVLFRSKPREGEQDPPPFELGMTSSLGWLGPVENDFGAIKGVLSIPVANEEQDRCRAWIGDFVPQSYRFVPGHEYELYLIHHPGLDEARRIQAAINGPSRAAEGTEDAETGAPAGAPRKPEDYGKPLVLKPNEYGVIEVEERSASFIPRGDPLYDGWCLFRGMPAAECAVEQVRKLHAHLGALRYPIGDGQEPFLPSTGNGPGDFNKQGGGNLGVIDVRVWSAIMAFQRDATPPPKPADSQDPPKAPDDKRPFKLENPEVQRKLVTAKLEPVVTEEARKKNGGFESLENRWGFLEGTPVDWPDVAPARIDGVVDATTGAAIKRWLDDGLRKPGVVLVQGRSSSSGPCVMRPELAESLWAWDQAAKALGFTEGVMCGSAYRNPLAEVGTTKIGVASNSPHKLGIAVDTGASGEYVRSVEGWPVAFARTPETAHARARWYVFGPSTQPIPLQPDPDLRKQEAKRLAGILIEKLTGYKFDPAPVPALAQAASAVFEKLLVELESPVSFFSRYFAAAVVPWSWSGLNIAGGSGSKPIGAQEYKDQHKGDYELPRAREAFKKAKGEIEELEAREKTAGPLKAKEQARLKTLRSQLPGIEQRFRAAEAVYGDAAPPRPATPEQGQKRGDARVSFLNLTKLAELSLGNRRPINISGIQAMAGMSLRFESYKSVQLDKIAAQLRKAAQLENLEDRVVLVTREKRELQFRMDDLDLDFLDQWFKSLQSLNKMSPPPRSAKAAAPRYLETKPPSVIIRISADPVHDAHYQPIADVLKQHEKQLFYADPAPSKGLPVRSGADWAKHLIEEIHKPMLERRDELAKRTANAKAEAEAKEKAEADAEAAAAAAAGKKYVPRRKKVAQPKPPAFELFALTLHPVFLKSCRPRPVVAATDLPILPGDAVAIPDAAGQPRGLEWWHFQRSDLKAGQEWFEMMESIGYSDAALRIGPFPELYGWTGMGHK